MDHGAIIMVFLFFLWSGSYGDQPLLQKEVQPSPQPYVFSYSAGRMPGHIDRVHSETSDGLGIVRGLFSYVDPREQIRTVEYIADQNGFHPILITNPNQDTRAVQNAKAKHYELYNRIAAEHQRVALERGQTEDNDYEDYNQDSSTFDPTLLISHPQDTPVVERAKLRHYDLYNRIALEHAKIAAERGHFQQQEKEEKVIKINY